MMKRFENVDVIDTLRKIMLHNTRYYQTDFEYDVRTLTDAAESNSWTRPFLWMSRESGTWCFPERDVYIKSTHPYNSWQSYRNDQGVKAFWVVFDKQSEDHKVTGSICELDYPKHAEQAQKSAVQPNRVELVFKRPAAVRVYDFEDYDKNWYAIHRENGDSYNRSFLVENEAALQNQIADIRNACFQEAEPAGVDEYVSEMVRQHFCSRGYTVGDMAYVIPDDVFEAVRRGIPAYALYPDNRKESIPSVKEADRLNMHGTLFGIRPDDKKLLDYLVERPSMKGELFSRKELLLLDSILLHTGEMNALNGPGRESLDRMIQKLDLVVSPTGNEANEMERSLDHEAESDELER